MTTLRLLAYGSMLTVLVRDGFATATPETVRAGKRPIKVTRMRTTDAGRQAIDAG
jgi:hypothetical protein